MKIQSYRTLVEKWDSWLIEGTNVPILSEEITIYLFIISTLIVCALFRLLTEKLKLKFNVSPFMLVTGVFIGSMFNLLNRKELFKAVFKEYPRLLLILVVPVMIYNMCISFDTNLLGKSWGQIFIIALPGLLINVCLVALIFSRITSESTLHGFLLTVMFAPIYPMDMMVYLKNVSATSRHVLTILQGESLVGTCIAFMLHHMLVGADLKRMNLWWEYLRFLVRFLVGGITVGYISGKIMARIMLCSSNDPIQTILVSWVGPFLIYFIVTVALGPGSGLVTLSVQGIIVAQKKKSLAKDSEIFLEKFWNFLALCSNCCGLLMVGMILGLDVIQDVTYENVAFMMLEYLINMVARFLEFLSIFYILRKIGYGITFNHLIVLAWGGILSVINLTIMVETYYEPEYYQFTRGALFHGAGATLLTMIVNVSIVPYLLSCLNWGTISLIKQSNMNKCIKHIMTVRDHTIDVMKLERFFCDANWPFIQETTVIAHPFRIENMKVYEEIENELEFEKVVVCPECHHDATILTTRKEMEDLTKEARRRILKAKQVSYSRQYESGMLSHDAAKILNNEVEFAMEGDFIIKTENLIKLFRPSIHLVRFRFLLFRMFQDSQDYWIKRRPRLTFRKFCYIIVINPFFEDFMCVVVLVNAVSCFAEMISRFHGSEIWNRTLALYLVFKSVSFVFFMIYVLEFVMKVLALSYVYIWRDGVINYFRSNWRIYEFVCLVISLIVVIYEITEMSSNNVNQKSPRPLPIFICCLGLLRVFRFIRVVYRLHPFVQKCIDGRINNKIMLAYSVGKGFIIGEDDILHILPNVILKKQLIEEIERAVEADKSSMSKELSLVQRERPLVAINVKTREAITTILNGMYDALGELKLMGWLDEMERSSLKDAISVQEVYMRRLGFVPANTPQRIFEDVPWMAKDDVVLKYLWSHSEKYYYETGEYVCLKDQMPKGVYIVISGLFKSEYKPDEDILKNYYRCGNLPVIDYISTFDIDKEIEDFFLSGNSFGELALLTTRPYSSSIISDCQSQAFLIKTEYILEAMQMDDDPIDGLGARMWTSLSLRLAFEVLVKSPLYFSVAMKDIEYSLLRAVVPDLEGVKVFSTSDIIEDIVLVNGLVMDINSKMVFYAPCYIPRNMKKIIFPPSSSMSLHPTFEDRVQTKLLLIARRDVSRNDIMAHIKRNCIFESQPIRE